LDSADLNRIGDLIIVGNTMINILMIIFLVIKIFLEAIALYKDLKRLKNISIKEKVATYLQLLALPIQQDNMGFEEMINYHCPPPKPSIKSFFKRKTKIADESQGRGDKYASGYLHKTHFRKNETSQNDTLDGEISLGNRETSMIDLIPGDFRGNHLDRFVRYGSGHTPAINESHHQNNITLTQQSERAPIREQIPHEDANFYLDPFSLPSESSPNHLATSLKSTITSLRVNKKKKRINSFHLNLDNSELQ